MKSSIYKDKGSETQKAAVVRDTVGNPFRDTTVPAWHALVARLSSNTLVIAPLCS
jgi:Na+/H+-translocating membrane pyrophosphatase